jgi:hypothetical protein
MYDGGSKTESYWDTLAEGKWVVMVLEKKRDYPRTRVNGSQIDYVIVSAGLYGREVPKGVATVNWGLAEADPLEFRTTRSDHVR